MSTVVISDEFAPVAKRAWIWSVVRGALAIVFGIVALVWPTQTAVVIAVLVGIFALVDGVVDLIEAIRYRGTPGLGVRVVLGVTSLVLGLIILLWPKTSLAVLAILFAIWWILIGALQIVANLQIRRQAGSTWVWGTIAGALAVIFGIIVLFTPKVGVITVIWIVGIWAILFGLLLLFLGFQLRKASKDIVPYTES